MHLDVIDLDADPLTQAEALATACETIGFFRLPLSVIPRQIADDAWNCAAEFFALSTEEKQKVAFPEAGYPYGYSPFRFESLAKSLDDAAPTAPDLKESLSVGPDTAILATASDAPDAPQGDDAWIRSPSLWPERPAELRQTWHDYYQALTDVSARVMSLMAIALDLDADFFDSLIDRPMTSMRAIHYPATPAEQPAGSIRAGAHTDYGTLTILRTDDVPGLEVRRPDQGWMPVAPDADTFVVNLGDSFQQWTNDRWRSTLHRVALTADQPRQSFAFFHMTNWDAVIECLPTCREPEKEPRHEPAKAGPWLMRKFQATVA